MQFEYNLNTHEYTFNTNGYKWEQKMSKQKQIE